MIIYEFAIVGLFFVVLIVAVGACGKPLAQAYAERMKSWNSEIAPREAETLRARVEQLESQVEDLRSELSEVKTTLNFALELQSANSKGGEDEEGSRGAVRPEASSGKPH